MGIHLRGATATAARAPHHGTTSLLADLRQKGLVRRRAVELGFSQSERLTSGQPSFQHAYRAFHAPFDLPALRIDPDGMFGDTRDGWPGRIVQR